MTAALGALLVAVVLVLVAVVVTLAVRLRAVTVRADEVTPDESVAADRDWVRGDTATIGTGSRDDSSTAEGGGGNPGGQSRVGATGTDQLVDLGTDLHREVEAELAALRLRAVHEAASVRAEGESMAAMARRLAEAEAETLRRTAQAEADNIRRAAQAEADNDRRRAELEVSTLLLEGRRSAEREAAEVVESARQVKLDIERREHRLIEREERLDSELLRLEARDHDLTELERSLAARDQELTERGQGIGRELQRVAGLTAAEAKAELVRAVEAEARRDAAIMVRDIEAEARQTGEDRARHIVTDAIQRVASEQTAESVVSVLHLPSDDMKGRIIGREGRNIRTFESVTGVNLIIDDTPEAVLLSCFDPVRREIGRVTLDKLIADGRIHPHRIEEVYEHSKDEVERLCVRAGEDALVAVGITEIHPELVTLLGRLRYRTSYGQNVLKHLTETAHIAGLMAAELGIDRTLVKRCAFLHDIGKALTHEVEGSHAIVGADLARRYGEAEEVVHAIEAHHNEVAPQTIEAVLTQAADACSGGRPGARRESLESYVKRLERIEEIASGRDGVERVFAMQAGREVRVMVQPDQVDDLTAQVIAREVAKQIEDELTYPGQIRVTVVRESRATEIAR
ncbi:MAG TPA: ribonuclease Y [Mycobacteriales bacterium]